MFTYLKSFRSKDEGAVTVDWVVLTAAIIGLSLAVVGILARGATDSSTSVGAFLSTHEGVTFP